VSTRTRPRTDAELRTLGMPDDVIAYRNGDRRAMTVPLRGIVVEGPTVEVVSPSAEVSREELGRKIHQARRRFMPRED
jgi:hypothetical protein